MTVGTRVYVARLAGVAVFDPNGDAVGRVRDVVVMFRPDRLPPRVLGLLVELQHRRRIFVPIGRVTSIEAGAVVLASGSVNLRRFEQRPGEALVLGALLDRTATIRETDAKVTVIDAAMEQTRTKDWVLTRLAVRDLGSRLARRRGQVRQVEWEELDGLGPTAEAEQGADDFSVEVMHKLGRPTKPMGELLFRVTGKQGDNSLSILTGHPLTEDRLRHMTEANQAASGPPLLTAEEWNSLKAICGAGEKPKSDGRTGGKKTQI